jgi:hypothetical protein
MNKQQAARANPMQGTCNFRLMRSHDTMIWGMTDVAMEIELEGRIAVVVCGCDCGDT